MTAFTTDHTVFYRWQWFTRTKWQGTFREAKKHSSGAFIELLEHRGLATRPVLDASCGLGLKTIVMREAGLNVAGSDMCALAIEHARTLAREEGSDIAYFTSTWADLPRVAPRRYAAVFNDALSWVSTDDEMAASLAGLHDVLEPGGLLVYMGALPGAAADQAALIEQDWDKKIAETGKYALGWQHVDRGLTVAEVIVLERGPDFIDKHHLYIIEEHGRRRLEAMTMRSTVRWSWPKIEPFLQKAGFLEFSTQEFIAANGKPFHVIVATRD